MFTYPQTPGLTSLKKVRSGWFAILLALAILISLLMSSWGLVAVPWYQSVVGAGKVIIYSPMDRAQEVDALIPGRVVDWYVKEGQRVKKGDKIALLQDIDSKFLDPQQALRTEQMIKAYRLKQEMALRRLGVIDEQRLAVNSARQAAVPAARQKVEQNRQKLSQNIQAVKLAKQNLETDRLQLDRIRTLEGQGLRSRRDLELAEQSWVRSKTDLERIELGSQVAQRDISMAQLDQERIDSNYDNEIAKLDAETLKAQETVAEAEAQVAKLQIDLGNLRQRQAQQVVVAPRHGKVVRLLKLGEGKSVKAGDPLCTVLPDVQDPAVEMWIADSDAPLVQPNQKVRLMFDGFPAIPFTAFPWAAVGTYGGVVANVDATDDGQGRYRVLVVPDKADGNIPWPALQEHQIQPMDGKITSSYPLRPGTQTQGWIMMERPVPIYWEIWRRLNAFPPVPKDNKSEGKEKPFQPKPVLKR